ncbi:MAG: response regulator [Acidobacteria bacterium]|nr:response regulator [Acidobacteriota bacterium]
MNTGRILVVDDSDSIRNVLQMNFEWLGYEVICATDGEEALRMVAKDPPDLIILDVMMPRFNGYQVCRTLKSDPGVSDIPVIFLTAKDQKEDRFWGKDCGADEYLTKPFSAAKLERVIERLLEDRERRATMGDITSRAHAMKSRGENCSIVTFSMERKAMAVFRQKYGEIKFREALDAVRRTIEAILAAEAPDFMMEVRGDGILRAVLPCDAVRGDAVTARIRTQGNLLLRGFYAREDAERGYVVTRANASGVEMHVPLLALDASGEAEPAHA